MFKRFFQRPLVLTNPITRWGVRAYGIMFRGDSEGEVLQTVEDYRQAFGLRPLVLAVRPIAND